MAISTKNKETERLTRTQAKRLKLQPGQQQSAGLDAKLMDISRHCSALPDLDTRSADEIIGYDEHGQPR